MFVCAQHEHRLGGVNPLGSWSQRPELELPRCEAKGAIAGAVAGGLIGGKKGALVGAAAGAVLQHHRNKEARKAVRY
jgi:hypothetical protein